jgi:hypothetical protein
VFEGEVEEEEEEDDDVVDDLIQSDSGRSDGVFCPKTRNSLE